jgi:hypothetical protein
MRIHDNAGLSDWLAAGVIKHTQDKLGLGSVVNLFKKTPSGLILLDSVPNAVTAYGDQLFAGKIAGSAVNLPGYMASGSGTPPSKTTASTTLQSQISSRVLLDSYAQGTGGDDNDVIYTCTFPAGTCDGNWYEAGIFYLSTGNNMCMYTDFGLKTKDASDIFIYVWTLTVGAS